MKRTAVFSTNSQLWVGLVKPHKTVGKQTLSRWFKELLKRAGIDTYVFTRHSTRMASTSKDNAMGAGLDTILKSAGWASASNFQKFYNRDTQNKQEKKKKNCRSSIGDAHLSRLITAFYITHYWFFGFRNGNSDFTHGFEVSYRHTKVNVMEYYLK